MSFQHVNHKVKICTYNLDGEEFSIVVPLNMTVENVKQMMVQHFCNPMEVFHYSDGGPSCSNRINKHNKYRLVRVRNYQKLIDENCLFEENIIDNDKLLLVKCRKVNLKNQIPSTLDYFSPFESDVAVSMDRIASETKYINSVNMQRSAEQPTPLVDFKISIRRILLTLIEASARLISMDENCANIFTQIFIQLDKINKPRIDKTALKQLIDMGFNEKNATTALIFKRNVSEAMAWLLDESNIHDSSIEAENDILNMKMEEVKNYFLGVTDPAANVIKEFNKHIYRWFQPDLKALHNLQDIGYGFDISQEALRTTFNNEEVARQLLEGNNAIALEMHQGYDRDFPIMAAIIESLIMQLALPKQKTLFALMVLCENPNSTKIWLSDTDTQPFISQILRIYHTEKYRVSKVTKSIDETLHHENSHLHSLSLLDRDGQPWSNPCRWLGTFRTPVEQFRQATSRISFNFFTIERTVSELEDAIMDEQ